MFDRPTSDQVVAALGAVYGVAGPGEVRRHAQQRGGWGGGLDALERVSVWFSMAAGDAEVTTSLRHVRDPAHVVSILVLRKLGHRLPRFPIRFVVDRRKLTIPVDGRAKGFTAYTCGDKASAVGRLGKHLVTVDCSPGLLRKVRLTSLNAEELSPYFDSPVAPARSPAARPDPRARMRERERRSRKTTVEALRRAFTGNVFGVSDPGSVRPDPWHPAAWDGWSGSPTAFHAGWVVGRWDDVQVATSLWNSDLANIVSNLLIHVVNRADRLRFPVELSVARETVTIPIDGQPQRFTAYVSESRARAVATVNGCELLIECPSRRLSTLSLATLTEREVRELLKSTTYRTPWSADG